MVFRIIPKYVEFSNTYYKKLAYKKLAYKNNPIVDINIHNNSMNYINYNKILERTAVEEEITKILLHFEKNKGNVTFKKGIYIYGAPGSGKTDFVMRILKRLNYDVIKYDASDIRNKSIIDTITKNSMAEKNVISMFHAKAKPIAIIMDEIDGMNNGDKGGINYLIKIIRQKKTKKQKLEEYSYNPIICISNYHVDKKIKELMKVCNTFELKSPLPHQIKTIINETMPMLDSGMIAHIITYLQGDLRKLSAIYTIYNNNNSVLKNEIIQNIFKSKCYNDDTKDITQRLINAKYRIEEHNNLMNDTNRTIVGLLWHENIIDVIKKMPKLSSIKLYTTILDKICFADYIDRITFQNQIWQFNEMSSLIKTFHCNQIYHDALALELHSASANSAGANSANNKHKSSNISEIRFTKVLTKYSTEYNNSVFIQELCQKLSMDKKDLFSYFLTLRMKYSDDYIYDLFEPQEITKLDINRIYRYIDKYTNKECKIGGNDGIHAETEYEIENIDNEMGEE